MGAIVRDLGQKNRALLAKRDRLQEQIDQWHRERKDQVLNVKEYADFLKQIGYLVPEGKNFKITTANEDAEIAAIAGAQLVVPLDNARYALNAANARWAVFTTRSTAQTSLRKKTARKKASSIIPVAARR